MDEPSGEGHAVGALEIHLIGAQQKIPGGYRVLDPDWMGNIVDLIPHHRACSHHQNQKGEKEDSEAAAHYPTEHRVRPFKMAVGPPVLGRI